MPNECIKNIIYVTLRYKYLVRGFEILFTHYLFLLRSDPTITSFTEDSMAN